MSETAGKAAATSAPPAADLGPVRRRAAPFGVTVVVLFALLALFGPLLAPYDPSAIDLAAEFQLPSARHWLGTHFFNPPRYLRLVEVVPTPATDPAVVDRAGLLTPVPGGVGPMTIASLLRNTSTAARRRRC